MFMRHYGDSLLKPMTISILAELFGGDDMKTINAISIFAISNAFYEQLLLHHDLDRLCIPHEKLLTSLNRTHERGDVLESYMAAIEMDVSRAGEGYHEVREWLAKVIALRLRKVPTTLQYPFTKTEATGKPIWWDSCVSSSSASNIANDTRSEIHLQPLPVRWHPSIEQIQLQTFRHSIFNELREIVCRTCQKVTSSREIRLRSFWIATKFYFDGLCKETICQIQEIQILLYYYRVSVSQFL